MINVFLCSLSGDIYIRIGFLLIPLSLYVVPCRKNIKISIIVITLNYFFSTAGTFRPVVCVDVK